MSKQIYFSTIHQIIKTGHWITDSVSSELKPFDISEPQYNVLRTLSSQKDQPLTVEQIGKQMIQRSSNVTRIIDKLLSKRLVSRKECPTNRRKMDIMITPAGSSFLGQLDAKLAEWHSPLLDKLSDEELKTLTQLIRKLRK